MSVNIAKLANDAVASKKGLPGIVTLISLMELNGSVKVSTLHAAAAAVTHVFCELVERGDLRHEESHKSVTGVKISGWLKEHYAIAVTGLLNLLTSDDLSIQTFSIDCLLKLVKAETESVLSVGKASSNWTFENNSYMKLVDVLCSVESIPHQEELAKYFASKLNQYDDLKLYFFRNLRRLSASRPDALNILLTYEILSLLASEDHLSGVNWAGSHGKRGCSNGDKRKQKKLKTADNSTETVAPAQSRILHRKAFTECWLQYLKLHIPPHIFKRILLMVHKDIIPHMTQPNLLADFLTDAYNIGGAISLLALNGLFVLISEHNLNYPDFYAKLYTLLDKNLLSVKYRSRFFRLLELFLTSSYLPTYLIAAFIKRLARLSLLASPSSIVVIIPFIYNLMKKHPSTIVMIHKVTSGLGPAVDPFIMSEDDPSKCQAIDSSLWELQALQDHYHPSVAGLAKVFLEPLTKPAYNLEDFLDLSYGLMYDMELKKQYDNVVTSLDQNDIGLSCVIKPH